MKIYQWLRRQLPRREQAHRHRTAGFTLLELLIALLLGSVVISSLMFLVIEMLKIERRETAVDNTQRDMKRALEYIASDVAEAIYVYVPDDAGTWDPAVAEFEDRFEAGDTSNVVLAFWRPDFVEDGDDLPTEAQCNAIGDDDDQRACENLRGRRGYYTLVIYEVVPNAAGGVWEGQARLVRYELPKYTDPGDLEETFVSDGPFRDGNAIFNTWRPEEDGGIDPSSPNLLNGQVLVDFVANPENDEIEAECRGDALTPVPPGDDAPKSFYACIRASNEDNQNLEIFLQGDFEPIAGASDALGTSLLNQSSLLPTLRTGVFVQGVIGYDPASQ